MKTQVFCVCPGVAQPAFKAGAGGNLMNNPGFDSGSPVSNTSVPVTQFDIFADAFDP